MEWTIISIAGSGEQGYAGDGGDATKALMDNPFHVDIDKSRGLLYIADCFNYCIRQVDMKTQAITTIAGTEA